MTAKYCRTDDCHRTADYVFISDFDRHGELLEESEEHPLCEQCFNAIQWSKTWPSDYSFRIGRTIFPVSDDE